MINYRDKCLLWFIKELYFCCFLLNSFEKWSELIERHCGRTVKAFHFKNHYREFPKFQECGFKSHQCHFFIIDEGGDGRKSYYIAVYMKALELIIEPFF